MENERKEKDEKDGKTEWEGFSLLSRICLLFPIIQEDKTEKYNSHFLVFSLLQN